MLPAIDFDNQECICTYEIDNVGAYPVLTPKLVAAKSTIRQATPKHRLGIRLRAAQIPLPGMIFLPRIRA